MTLFEDGKLKVSDSMGKDDSFLVGWKGKPTKGEIIHCPFVPKMLVETDEEREARYKRERAGKRFATVKLSNGNAHHRGKRGQILDSGNGKSLLEIETVNSCSSSGCHTLMGVVYPHGYEKIWFDDSELEKFEEYDKDGNLV